jgi:O-antigen/teichoic acid export membrane protein
MGTESRLSTLEPPFDTGGLLADGSRTCVIHCDDWGRYAAYDYLMPGQRIAQVTTANPPSVSDLNSRQQSISIVKSAFRGGMWLSAFTLVGQCVSWSTTLVVARLLSPSDYGLMDMAFILGGYVQVFFEMGIGAAIIQRKEVSDEELSSVFWALLWWASLLAVLCLALAYPTVLVFNEPRILHVTQSISILFILGALFIVPNALLKRRLRFKALGVLQSVTTVVSCAAMLVLAYLGAGVWTLMGGFLIRSLTQVILGFSISGWRPKLHFSRIEALPFLRFGLPVVGGNSLQYIYARAPVFFAGRAFSATVLGYYSLAFQLASIPNDKIVGLLSHVSYPVLSRLQNDDASLREFLLRFSQLIAFLVLPMYCGAIFLAGDLIPWLLGPKWLPAVVHFRILCVGFIALAVNKPIELANTAQGRPLWVLWFQAACALVMTTGFWLSVASGSPVYLALPWVIAYIPIQFVYARISLRKIGIPIRDFGRQFLGPAVGTSTMVLFLCACRLGFQAAFTSVSTTGLAYIVMCVLLGLIWYACYLFLFNRVFLVTIAGLARRSHA